MATPTDIEEDAFMFPSLQLNVETERRGMHQRNSSPYEVQRPNVLDDICLGLLLQARIDRVVHGRSTKEEGGTPTTLVVFGFRFHGLNRKRRFKEATITIVFEDEKKPGTKRDPEVVALWPNGDFTLGKTPVQVENKDRGEVGGDAGVPLGGTGAQLGTHYVRTWERTESFERTNRATLTGSIILDTTHREWGNNNAVTLTLCEDDKAKTSIVTDLRAAVLLERQNDADIFTAKVDMKAKGDFAYNVFSGIRNLSRFSPANDPVRFKPGVQYIRRRTLHPAFETKLNIEIDKERMSVDQLEKVAGVLGSTVLSSEASAT
ncbi:uncharacterized protein F4812DRAFT_209510 [Daldinia caldariorum]|uniref:uncharacterized protein n=1 Tax=Daldinia caldariorum TaxID=326644 RepID=UPI002007EDCB|nr:uncharacterized protein F4812DRAFT_209510 [Daldinia caldariorum]KAI1464373.1 hypothetical protein F4812DRAFT_209510 [Daldinia caldariorum]